MSRSYFVKQFMREMAQYVLYASQIVNDDEVEKMIQILLEAMQGNKKILVVGAGRSGLAGRAFAMRLMPSRRAPY